MRVKTIVAVVPEHKYIAIRNKFNIVPSLGYHSLDEDIAGTESIFLKDGRSLENNNLRNIWLSK